MFHIWHILNAANHITNCRSSNQRDVSICILYIFKCRAIMNTHVQNLIFNDIYMLL